MDRKEITDKTLEVFRKIFGNQANINESSSAEEIEKWDSLNHILLIQELEKAFGIKFDLFEIIDLNDVQGIITYIFSKKGR